MPFRIAVVCEPPDCASARHPAVGEADLLLDWRTDRANVLVDVPGMCRLMDTALAPAAADLLDIAIAIYTADIAVKRGKREHWTRAVDLAVPVRLMDVWADLRGDLERLVYMFTRDSVTVSFYQAPTSCDEERVAPTPPIDFQPDCVSMLSGGLDSLAGAVMLQRTDRQPLYSMHRSGNPIVRRAQDSVWATIDAHWPGRSALCDALIQPHPRGADALPFPPPEEREPSRRARSLLFMVLAILTAEGAGVNEVFMCENGLLSTGLPLSRSRAGSMSTRSTHPAALTLFNDVVAQLGLGAQVLNPFIYQTKADLVKDVLAPNLSPREIQSTVSCWATGRAPRQCGGCVPCLLRRIAMTWAGLPEEAYMVDVLGSPRQYVGTDAYGNLVDLLRHARHIAESGDVEILSANPDLLALQSAGLSLPEVITMLRRHAEQTLTVVRRYFPEAARLIR